jgi:alkylhydroperoxidase family enzyme
LYIKVCRHNFGKLLENVLERNTITANGHKNGATPQRIFLLNAWRETGLFTEKEKRILAITEAVTLIHSQGLPDNIYEKAEQHFTKNYIAQVIMAAVTINAWNRIAISTQMQPAP